jgi:hypothetical protein
MTKLAFWVLIVCAIFVGIVVAVAFVPSLLVPVFVVALGLQIFTEINELPHWFLLSRLSAIANACAMCCAFTTVLVHASNISVTWPSPDSLQRSALVFLILSVCLSVLGPLKDRAALWVRSWVTSRMTKKRLKLSEEIRSEFKI